MGIANSRANTYNCPAVNEVDPFSAYGLEFPTHLRLICLGAVCEMCASLFLYLFIFFFYYMYILACIYLNSPFTLINAEKMEPLGGATWGDSTN